MNDYIFLVFLDFKLVHTGECDRKLDYRWNTETIYLFIRRVSGSQTFDIGSRIAWTLSRSLVKYWSRWQLIAYCPRGVSNKTEDNDVSYKSALSIKAKIT